MKFEWFVLLYTFMKLVRIMMAATVLMTAALVICKIAGTKNWRFHLAMFSLVPVSCFMGNSKLFFTGRLFLVTNWLQCKLNEQVAVFYFLMIVLLAVRNLYMRRYLHKKLLQMRRMKELEKDAALQCRGQNIRVYLSKECGSPFAGGMCKPYIVLPETFYHQLSKKQLSAVLYHEALHIRQGHVFLLNIYAWLKIFWWIHPLIYILEGKLREYMEYSSDEGSVILGPLSPYEYANVILMALQIQKQTGFVREGIMTFQDHRYHVLKKRVKRLSALTSNDGGCCSYQKKKRLSFMLSAAACLMAAVIAIGTSMPRYTRIEEISAYDEKLHPLTYDLEKEGFHAQALEDDFYISRREMERFSEKYHLQGDYVIFSYDTIMKVPGVGGFGQAARVRIKDPSDVFLMARQEWIDRFRTFVMKYLI